VAKLRVAFDRPVLTYRVLVPALVVFWFVSSVGQHHDDPSAHHPHEWVGRTGWVLFAVAFVATVLFTIVLLVRRLLRRTVTP
jgi:hypothetical protein